jgi:hypothetical protein
LNIHGKKKLQNLIKNFQKFSKIFKNIEKSSKFCCFTPNFGNFPQNFGKNSLKKFLPAALAKVLGGEGSPF